MIIPLLLALLMPVSHALAAEADAPPAAAEKTHPDLILLEKDLTRAQGEKKDGKLAPELYAEWETGFRSRLSAAMEFIPPSPVNQAAHARLVALLGDRKEAQASLDQALVGNPDNPVLLRTKGQLLLEQKDFAGAAEHGKRAWEESGRTDKDALALYNTAKGRVAPAGAESPSPTAGSTPSGNSTAASSDDPSKPYKLPVKGSAKPSEVPALATDSAPVAPSSGPGLLTMLGIGAGVLLIAWGAVPAETKERLKQDLWEQPKQELKVMAAVTAVGAVAYGGYLVLPSILGAVAPTGAAMTPVFAGGGTAGGGIALQQAAVGTAKAAILAGGTTLVLRKASDYVSFSKSDKSGADNKSSGDTGPDNKKNRPQFHPDKSEHIFGNREGHLPDTPENRKLFLDTTAEARNLVGVDKYGSQWYARLLENGKQIWVQVWKDGTIRNAGLNKTPLPLPPQ